ncbi:unnamed protein product [Acanthocheilonema viteae]|uniref:Uncharacterized protein n=1 Tax=Acanthocheilonema viteae TaxID=6277 RepID=A0A498SFR5_ACAVI|nr:unnamed protein product [Acanthocheilonema viteae]
MHNRIKDVKSGSDDNDDIGEGKDKVCLDGIDTRKYPNFLALFNTLKKRNASSVDVDRTRHLSPVQQEGSECKNVSVVDDYVPNTLSQQSDAISQNSNDEHVLESCQISEKLQPNTCSTMDLTTVCIL